MHKDSISDLRLPVFSARLLPILSLLLAPSPMTTSPTSVTAQFQENDNDIFTFPRSSYYGTQHSFDIQKELLRQQTLKSIAAERVKMLSWELTLAKEAVDVMTRLLPNAK